MLRGTTYMCVKTHTHCPVTAGDRSGLPEAERFVRPDCSQGTFDPLCSRRLTPAAFSLCLRKGTTRLITAFCALGY